MPPSTLPVPSQNTPLNWGSNLSGENQRNDASGSTNIDLLRGGKASSPASRLTTAGRSTHTKSETPNQHKFYVLLSVPLGDDICLKQFHIQDYNDDKFFRQLRKAYMDAKGLLRLYLGVRKYAHCDFYKFEKFDAEEFVALDADSFPPDNDDHYRYTPRPVQKMPPIRPHEFKKRYYWCYGRCIPALFGVPNPFHKCKKRCYSCPDAVNLVPKRTLPLETSGDAREEFWGLYAREVISAKRVAVYMLFILVAPFVFWLLWLFNWGHSGDLQNASVPFLCTLGLSGLFITSLYHEKVPASR